MACKMILGIAYKTTPSIALVASISLVNLVLSKVI